MTKDEIIRMAREAGLGSVLTRHDSEPRVWIEGADWHDELCEFVRLVAAAEREACANVCDDKAKETFSGQCQAWGDYFARAIRARGQ